MKRSPRLPGYAAPAGAGTVAVIAGAIAVAVILVMGLSWSDDRSSPTVTSIVESVDRSSQPPVEEILYRGEHLYCIVHDPMNSAPPLSCDFVRFYAEHPALAKVAG